MKRRTNTEIIESESPEVEHSYVKPARERVIPTTREPTESSVKYDLKKTKKILSRKDKKYFKFVHTHKGRRLGAALPGPEDISSFIINYKSRTNAIAVRDDAGKRIGYTMLFKKKKPETYTHESNKLGKAMIGLYQQTMSLGVDSAENPDGRYILDALESVLRMNDLDIRFHPVKGYYFDKKSLRYEKKPEHSLEGVVGSILIGFTILFLLIKVPFTGFVVSDSSANDTKGLFFVLGLLLTTIVYFALKKNKKID